MKIHQLSVFLENKPGHMVEPCRLLANAAINVRTLMLADTHKYGILRVIVSDWERGRDTLRQAGFTVNIREVLAVEVPDRPGGLAHLLEVLDQSPVNIEYMYAFSELGKGKAIMIFRFDDADKAAEVLNEAGINLRGAIDIYQSKGS